MNDPTHPLTPSVQAQICAFIHTGAYPHIAAEAAGIPQKVFFRWMIWGKARRPVPLYRDFVQAVSQAQAIARLAAEARTFERAPLSWLRSGPGRESGKSPGWTNPVKPATPAPKGPGLSSERLWQLGTLLLNALQPFPDARAAVAQVLEQLDLEEQHTPEDTPRNSAAATTVPSSEKERQGEALSGGVPQGASERERPSAQDRQPAPPDTGPVSKSVDSTTVPSVPAANLRERIERKQVPTERPARSTPPSGEARREAVAGNRATGIEAATKVQATSNDPTTKQQPTSSQPALKPQRKARNVWEELNATHWDFVISG